MKTEYNKKIQHIKTQTNKCKRNIYLFFLQFWICKIILILIQHKDTPIVSNINFTKKNIPTVLNPEKNLKKSAKPLVVISEQRSMESMCRRFTPFFIDNILNDCIREVVNVKVVEWLNIQRYTRVK